MLKQGLTVRALLAGVAACLAIVGGVVATEAVADEIDPPITNVRGLPDVVLGGHRNGALEFPEGSTAGANALLSKHIVQVLDYDLFPLADGTPVVMHDGTADRLTDRTGPVSSMTLRQWQSLRLDPARWFGPGWPAEQPMTAAELLDRFKGRAVLLVEAKTDGLIPRIADEIRSRDMVDQVIVQSHDPVAVRRIADLGLHAQLWRTAGEVHADDPSLWTRSGAQSIEISAVTAAADVRKVVSTGLPVWAYQADTPAAVARLRRLGVTGLISDTPIYAFGRAAQSPRPVGLTVAPVTVVTSGTAVLRIRSVVPAIGGWLPDVRFVVRFGGYTLTGRTDRLGAAVLTVRPHLAPGRYPVSTSTDGVLVTAPYLPYQGLRFTGSTMQMGSPSVVTVVPADRLSPASLRGRWSAEVSDSASSPSGPSTS